MDLVGSCLDQGFEKSHGDARGRLLVQFGEGELGGSVDRHEQVELAFFGADLGDVDVEVTDRIGLELLLARFVAFDFRQPRNAMTLQAAVQRGARRSLYVAEMMELFDHVIESAKIGLRKPDPRIYQMMTEALGVDPRDCVYLDDLGVNLKPARELGMITIKVLNASQAIGELEAVTGLALR